VLFPLAVGRVHNNRAGGMFSVSGYEGRGSFRTELRRNVFTQILVNLWNSLPQKAVGAESLNIFKKEMGRLLDSKGVKRVWGGGGGQECGILIT